MRDEWREMNVLVFLDPKRLKGTLLDLCVFHKESVLTTATTLIYAIGHVVEVQMSYTPPRHGFQPYVEL